MREGNLHIGVVGVLENLNYVRPVHCRILRQLQPRKLDLSRNYRVRKQRSKGA